MPTAQNLTRLQKLNPNLEPAHQISVNQGSNQIVLLCYRSFHTKQPHGLWQGIGVINAFLTCRRGNLSINSNNTHQTHHSMAIHIHVARSYVTR